jgi:hypothetical protein
MDALMKVTTFLLSLAVGWTLACCLEAYWTHERRVLIEQTGAVCVDHPTNYVVISPR